MHHLLTGFRVALLAVFVFLPAARAFPPAPDGLIYGEVKDQYGTPLTDPKNTVILQTSTGVQVTTTIQPGLAIGVNYALRVPMDTGLIASPYVANALTTKTPYLMFVAVNSTTNLPVEMTGAPSLLGAPAQRTLQNLTMGTDVNGDGIPDAWEAAFLASSGINASLTNINADASYTSDGRTLRQEYLLGNYPYDPNAFRVKIVSQQAGSAVLSFTTTSARTYTAYGSPDLQNWTPLNFTVPAAGSGSLAAYYSTGVQTLQIQTIQPANAPAMQFFRLSLQ